MCIIDSSCQNSPNCTPWQQRSARGYFRDRGSLKRSGTAARGGSRLAPTPTFLASQWATRGESR
eukprot:1783734-Pyramimonas_sp.AAC.1